MLKRSSLFLFLTFLLLGSWFQLLLPQSVHAAQPFGEAYVRFSRMKAATAPGTVRVVFTTSSASSTEAKIKITLDSEFVSATHFSTTAANYTTAAASGFTAPPTLSAAATDVTGNTITFTTGTLAASTQYGFDITGTGFILNPSASTSIVHTIFTTDSGDTVIDTKDVTSPVISDDQVVITATVAPTFTFTFSNNSQSLGTLATGSVNSGSGTNITIVSNAPNGWNTWVKDTAGALSSANAAKDITTTGTLNDTPDTISGGTEGYVLDVNINTDASGGGTVSIADEYNGGDTSSGGTLSSTFQLAASADGTANSDIITFIPRVTISGNTPAASDYTDTLTIVGAGIF